MESKKEEALKYVWNFVQPYLDLTTKYGNSPVECTHDDMGWMLSEFLMWALTIESITKVEDVEIDNDIDCSIFKVNDKYIKVTYLPEHCYNISFTGRKEIQVTTTKTIWT